MPLINIPGHDTTFKDLPRPAKPVPSADVSNSSPEFTTSYWGQPIPVGFGRRKVVGQIVWASGIRYVGGNRYCDMAISFGYSITPAAERDEIKLVTLYFNGKKIYSLLSSDTLTTYADGALTTVGSVSTSANSTKPKLEIRWYEAAADQRPNPVITKKVGADDAVAYRNMMYAVLTNVNLDKLNLTEAPVVEALIAESYTVNNLYDRASSTDHPTVSNSRSVWNINRNFLYNLSSNGATLRSYNYTTLKQKSAKTLKGSYDIGPDVIDHALSVDSETDLIAVVTGDNSASENRAIHLVNPKTLIIGDGYSGGTSTDVVFSSTVAGCVARSCFAHAGSTATEYTFLAVTPDTGLDSADRMWLGILKVNANDQTLTYVTRVDFDHEVISVFASDELRVKGWATLYVGCTDGHVYRVRVNQQASSVTSSGLVQVSDLGYVVDTETGTVEGGLYVPQENAIVLVHNDDYTSFVKLPLGFSNAFSDQLFFETADALNSAHARFIVGSDVSAGSFWVQRSAASSYNISLEDMTIDTYGLGTVVYVGDTSATDQSSNISVGAFWDSKRNAFLVGQVGGSLTPAVPGPGIVWPRFGYLADASGITIANVIRWMCLYAGYTAEQINVDGVPTSAEFKCLGGQWVNSTDVWDELLAICDAYGIDVYESGGVIKFVRWDSSSGTYDDLLSDEFIPLEESLITRISRQRSEDLPSSVTVKYYDPNTHYNTNVQLAKRSTAPGKTSESSGTADYDLPLVLYAVRARSIASNLLYKVWEAQEAITFNLSKAWIDLEPSDVVGLSITMSDDSTKELVVKIRDVVIDNETLSLSIVATEYVLDDDYTFPHDADSAITTEPLFYGLEQSVPLVLDVPTPEGYSASVVEVLTSATPVVNADWPGTLLYREKSGSLELAQNVSGDTQPLVMVLESTLASALPWAITEQSVDVSVVTGAASKLASASYTDLMNGANLALVGNSSDGYEYVQFRDVTDNNDGTYTLTGFIRGRRGTEYLITDWLAGEDFILVERPQFKSLDVTTSLSGTLHTVTAGFTQDIDEGYSEYTLIVGNSLKPFAPTDPEITSGSWGSDMTFSFKPRTRGAFEIPTDEDIADFPYDEDTVEFEVAIIDTDGTTVLRTFTALTSPAFSYTAVQQAADFASKPTPLFVRIYQISDNGTIDRGYSNLSGIDV